MAAVTYIGAQRAQAQAGTLTVTTADTAGTITVTVGGSAAVVITPTTADTTTTAEELLAAVQTAAQTNPVIAEVTFSQAANVVTFVGPADGAPLAIAKTDGGGNVTALAATGIAAPLSPFDAADGTNYSTGALPVDATDSLVCEQPGAAIRYGLTALAAVGLTDFVRRSTFGPIGLPDNNPAGYREFRPTHLSLNCATALVETSSADPAQSVRLNNVTTACTYTVQGDQGGGQIGAEAVTLKGTSTAAAVNATGGSVAITPLAGESLAVTTLRGINATIRVGAGCTLGTPNFFNCNVLMEASWASTMVVDGGAVTVGRAATGALTVDSGAVVWKSTANPGGSPAVGGGATLDLSQAPNGLTIGGTALLYAGATLNDVAGRGGNYAVQLVRCTLQEVNWVTPNSKTFTTS